MSDIIVCVPTRTELSKIKFMYGGNDMKKVMISMPMRGKSTEQVKAEWNIIASKLESEGYAVVNTVFDFLPGDSALYSLAKSLEVMDKCNVVFFAKGFEEARGCVVEWYCASKYGKEIIYQN